jgi:branched-chain amino acid transport system substrate-binding protein
MRHYVRAVAALVALTLGGTAAQAADTTAPIRVGFSITETGPQAAPAIFNLQGYQLGADYINAHGGILGRKVELVHYDDQGNPSTALQLYQKLITDDKVDLLVSPYQTDLTSAVAPLVTRSKIVMTAVAANTGAFQGQYPYLVQAMTQTGRYMEPLLDLAASKGYKTIALLIQQTQFPSDLGASVKESAKRHGMDVVFEESYPPSTTDFGPLVLKAAAKNADVLIGATYLADAEGIVRAAKAQNVKAKMFGFSIGPVEPDFGRALGSAADNVFGTTLWYPTLSTKDNAEFVKSFQAKFGRPPDYHAAVAYASILVLAHAANAAKVLDQEKIREALHKTQMDTVAGHFALSPTGVQLGYTAFLLQWRDGKQVLVWPKQAASAAPVVPFPGWK